MPNKKSAEKRVRKTERQTLRNKMWKSSVHTHAKKVLQAIENKADKTEIESAMNAFLKVIDTAAGKGVIHKRKAARRKSRMQIKVNEILKTAQ